MITTEQLNSFAQGGPRGVGGKLNCIGQNRANLLCVYTGGSTDCGDSVENLVINACTVRSILYRLGTYGTNYNTGHFIIVKTDV